jgi:N-acyl-L-homoserine lactone synthetase
MQATTLSFNNLHKHGDLFANMLRARHRTFIERNHWDLPQADGMEFDQYDTPASRWVAVHDFGRVLAGVRLTPTIARVGIYSYMIRDAQRGLLETIPRDLLWEEAPVAPHIWESSRVFVSEDVPAKIRLRVQIELIGEMVRSARDLGATQVLGLIPEHSPRLARRTGIDCVAAGPVLEIDGSRSVCVNISMATKLH